MLLAAKCLTHSPQEKSTSAYIIEDMANEPAAFNCGEDGTVRPVFQQKIIKSCESGHLQTLQRLLETVCQPEDQRGDHSQLQEGSCADGPPPTSLMVYKAIEHKQPEILAYLFTRYPDFVLNSGAALYVAVRRPDSKTFKTLLDHCPSILEYDGGDTHDCALTVAFQAERRDPTIPVLMLEHGSDPNNGGFSGMGPLWWAVYYDQPVEVITKMVEMGGIVHSSIVTLAVSKQSLGTIRFLIDRYREKDRGKILNLCLERAQDTKNDEVIALVDSYIKGSGARVLVRPGRNEQDRKEKAKQIALNDGFDKHKEVGGLGMQKRWWQVWK